MATIIGCHYSCNKFQFAGYLLILLTLCFFLVTECLVPFYYANIKRGKGPLFCIRSNHLSEQT